VQDVLLLQGRSLQREPDIHLPISSTDPGSPQRCPDMQFASTPPFDGTLAGFYKLPADMCYRLSDSVSLEEGALIEPLAVGVMAVNTIGQMPLGANVVGELGQLWLPSTSDG